MKNKFTPKHTQNLGICQEDPPNFSPSASSSVHSAGREIWGKTQISNELGHILNSPEETRNFAKQWGETRVIGDVICFSGDLGAGKTTFIQGLVEGIHKAPSRDISSPTFSLLNIYAGQPPIYHFDLYRIPRLEEFIAAGFNEYLDDDGICCIEWAEKIGPLLPAHAIHIEMSYLSENKRKILITQANR